MAEAYDIIIIGGGPGGYVASIRARQLGLKTLVVEKDRLGGVCLNIGCIPSKALIEKARALRAAEDLQSAGLVLDKSGLDYGAVQAYSRTAADKLSRGVSFLLKKNGVDVVSGLGSLAGPREVVVKDQEGKESRYQGKSIVVASGSRPRELPGFEFDEKRVLSSTGALMLKELPGRLVILGAGAIGMEMAYVMNSFGVQVTVVEMLDAVLPMEDPDVATVVRRAFEKRGVRFLVGTKALSLDKPVTGPLTLRTEPVAGGAGESLQTDAILVSTGRLPNTAGLGLEALGVRLDRGYVQVGDYYETAAEGLYAIGDLVAGEPQLAHVASAQGEIAVERIAQLLGLGDGPRHRRLDRDLIPGAVYCEPQVAAFGPREASLNKAGRPYLARTFPYRGIGKAVAMGEDEGFAKVLIDPDTREIIGASVVGAEATELIHELLLAKSAELLPEDLGTMVHAHPSLSELVKETALASLGRAIHA